MLYIMGFFILKSYSVLHVATSYFLEVDGSGDGVG